MVSINGEIVKELNLYYNRLIQIPSEIFGFTLLTILNLSHNMLTHLPVEICNLTQLTTINLYDNMLTQLPREISKLTQLTTLYLSHNMLSSVPVEIGQLRRMNTLYLSYNMLTLLPVEIGHLTQLSTLDLSHNMIENILNPIIQRLIQRIENRQINNTIYNDAQNIHSSSIQLSIKDSIYQLMNSYQTYYPLITAYLDWTELHPKTKEIITEYIDTTEIHSVLNITFKELFIAVLIEMDKLSPDLQKEIKQRLNEEMHESECKCFTGRISRLVNCLSGYSDKVKIQISENDEIGNIISVIMQKRGIKTIEMLKEEVIIALKERGYTDGKIDEWLEYIE